MSSLPRYNLLAPVYNVGIAGDFFYRKARREAIDQLDLAAGDRVMILFCGTGFDFELIKEQITKTGYIIAVDGAAGMLKRARSRSRKLAFANGQIDFLQADFSQDSGVAKICEAIQTVKPAKLLISMGMNCMADWKPFFTTVFETLEAGTKISMFDLYSDALNIRTRILNGVGAGDCRREIWQGLKSVSVGFHLNKMKWVTSAPCCKS